MYLKQEDEDSEQEVGCILRYKLSNFLEGSSPRFECESRINDNELSRTVLDADNEDLVSDIIAVRRVDKEGQQKFDKPIVVAIPYNKQFPVKKVPIVKFASLDDVLKRSNRRISWKVVKPLNILSIEETYEEIQVKALIKPDCQQISKK